MYAGLGSLKIELCDLLEPPGPVRVSSDGAWVREYT